MAVQLIVRPIVKKVNRAITLPRTARLLRPEPSVTRQVRAAIQHPGPVRPPVQQRRQPAISPRSAPRSHQLKGQIGKSATVKYTSRDVPEAHRQRLRSLRNCGIGKVLVIMANGPSILEVDTRLLLNNPRIDIMSINKPDLRVWPTKYWLFCDTSQLLRNRDIWSHYDGYIFNSAMISEFRPGSIQIKNIHGEGFSFDPTQGFHIGRSSVYAAQQVAIWMGYDRIYIFGCDMCAVNINGQPLVHFFGNNPDVQPESRVKRFADEAKYYNYAAKYLPAEVRNKFYFCSSYNPFDFVSSFNRLDHHTAIQTILDGLV